MQDYNFFITDFETEYTFSQTQRFFSKETDAPFLSVLLLVDKTSGLKEEWPL